MERLKEKLKDSFFIVNKLYMFVIFLFLTLEDISLGIYYFLLSGLIYLWRWFIARVPIKVDREFICETYVYKETDTKELKLDLWLPSRNKKYPVVFFCHGGGWISGFRNQPNSISWCKFLASRNFAAVSIDYRYAYKNSIDDILSDYTDALNYIRANNEELSIDVENITLMGLSAGGHLSLLYSTYYTYKEDREKMSGIKGVVSYYGPTDLKDMLRPDTKSILSKFATRQTFKADPDKEGEVYDYYSPITWVSERMVPCFLAHGRNDNVVPYNSSVKFAKRLKDHKVKYEFLAHKSGKHSFDTYLDDIRTINILKRTIRFIKHL